MIRIFIVAEVRLYREGLKLGLARNPGIEVVGTCARLSEALSGIRELEPDIILLDMLTAHGLSVLDEVRQYQGAPRIVAIGVGDEDPEIVACAEFGISGLLHRDATLKELTATLECTMRGEFRYSRRAVAAIVRRVADLGTRAGQAGPESPLTEREMQIVALIDRGLSNKDIARRLGIELATVKNHVHHVLEKLNVSRRGEAVAHLRRSGLMPPLTDPGRLGGNL